MADFAVTFGEGSDQYAFPNVSAWEWSFAGMRPVIADLPGAHGGFDQHHTDEDRAGVGSAHLEFMLETDSSEAMQALIDQVTRLPYLGRQLLTYQPQGSYAARWCYARVSKLDLGLSADMGLKVQKVKLTFAVPDPFWRHDEESHVIAASGTSTSATVTNTGNAVALARVTFAPGVGDSCENPTIQRLVSAVAVDEMAWTGTVDAGETLTMNAARKAVLLDTTGSYAGFAFTHPDWLRLLPGANELKVVFANAGDAATVTVYWSDTFR